MSKATIQVVERNDSAKNLPWTMGKRDGAHVYDLVSGKSVTFLAEEHGASVFFKDASGEEIETFVPTPSEVSVVENHPDLEERLLARVRISEPLDQIDFFDVIKRI